MAKEKVEEQLEKYGFVDKAGKADPHWVETSKPQIYMTSFPRPEKFYRLVYESYQISMEETYFWVMNYLAEGFGFADIEKITDVFTPSEYSAFGGVSQQRIGMQQDKVSTFLHTIAKLIKELFQLVREMRIIDERLSHYHEAQSKDNKNFSDAQITLKGLYIDQVEGGAKSPSSVYGMSREVQFTTLPDLFFMTNVEKAEDISAAVDPLKFNRKVKEVLRRKLYAFMKWKEHTQQELETRRRFTLQYMRQHFDVILMYMDWTKPYLKTIRRMQTDQRKSDMPDIIGAFEGAMIETEILAKGRPEGNKEYIACIDINIIFRVRPTMSYTQEHYQRGPIHVGRAEITWRAYAWNEKQIENYKKYREDEVYDLIGMIDKNIQDAMDYLGEELKSYLKESGEKSHFEKQEEKKEEKPKPGEFGSIVQGFKDVFIGMKPSKPKAEEKPKKQTGVQKLKGDKEKKAAVKYAKVAMWNCYKNYKKAHKMIAW